MQLFLYFSAGLAPLVVQELEITVEESLTVKEVNSFIYLFFFKLNSTGEVKNKVF